MLINVEKDAATRTINVEKDAATRTNTGKTEKETRPNQPARDQPAREPSLSPTPSQLLLLHLIEHHQPN